MADFSDDDYDDYIEGLDDNPMDLATTTGRRAEVTDSLVAMLSQAWRDWFGMRGEPVALLGQLLDIVRNTSEGRAGRPADAVGVSASTWNRWILYARQMPGGSQPSARSRVKISAAVRESRLPDNDVPTPTRVIVTAVVVWNGYQNGRDNPLKPKETPDMSRIRTTTLDDLDLQECRRSWVLTLDWQSARDLLDALARRYGVPIELYNIESLTLED